MEIKLKIENSESGQEATFWINRSSGQLNIQTDCGLLEIPNNIAKELIEELRGKLYDHEQSNQKFFNFWQK